MKQVLIILLFFYHHGVFGGIVKICKDCDVKDVSKAISVANECDTLILLGGKYYSEPILVDKSLVIIGKPESEIVSASGLQIITVVADYVSFSGVKFSGVKTNYLKENAAIRIKQGKYFEIENNIFEDCFFSIYLEKSKYGIIRNNQINGSATTEAESGNGIHAWYSSHLTIESNRITHQRDGIYFEFVDNSLIINNISIRNIRYGLHFMFSNDDEYRNNVFEGNGVGVAVMFSKKIKMIDNAFIKNWGTSAYGLLLKEINDAEIINNLFDDNTIGIFVEGSNRINYIYNTFSSNGWAFKFSGGCDSNDITDNNFVNNSLDMMVSSSIQNNVIRGNYWSEYTGYDLNKDGVGDVPYYPVKLYSYILDQVPESIVLMRSMFVDLVNYSEKVSPVFTPKDVIDNSPKMSQVND
ncbi:MAG: nitrous oxide reductase family maturation protein NosD [Saprospiraceae bacterium]|nr:nitrous oxide reductase family maturation protein NosD [Saprospiraceae bacterium]